ncbi:MAG: YebC/PmpR family DNA-binding transcriptional regulator [Candidatus Dasytiphilus stammeri]
MSGHSKWSNTKHRKAIQDAKRGNIFTKIIRDVVTAVKIGGSDPSINARLRAALNKACANNMNRDAINRAIRRAEAIINLDDSSLEDITYEGYGPGGTAIMIKCLSDNRKRTVSKLRHIFTKYGGNLAINGSVSYLFKQTGVISLVAPTQDEEQIINMALDAGAEDILDLKNGMFKIFLKPELLITIQYILTTSGFKTEKSSIIMTPITKIELDPKYMVQLLNLIQKLQSCDEIQEIYHNANEISITPECS